MSGSKGFSISIGVQDAATAKLDAINKRIAAMTAPAEKFNKSLAKFGEVTGINKLAEGMTTLGNNSLGAARAIEQMVSPMASITSAASVAGMAALAKQWADAGTQISKTAYQLNAPVEKVSAFEGAARLAGSSAEAMDAGLQGLNESLNKAAWAKDPQMIATLNQFHIGFKNADGSARSAADALGDVAAAVKSLPTPHAQESLLHQLEIPTDLLPLLKDGREGLQQFTKQAQQTGGVMTAEMAANAVKMRTAFTRLAENFEGIGNRIINSWSGTTTSVTGKISDWIEHNERLADSITKIGIAVSAIGLIKPAAWVLRLLGLGALPAAATLASPLLLSGDTPTNPLLNQPSKGPGFFGQGGTMEQFIRHPFGGGSSPTAATPMARLQSDLLGSLANSRLGKLLAKGEAGAAGYSAVNRGAMGNYAAGMENLQNKTVAEVMADQAAHKYNAAGRYQIIGPTLTSAVSALGLTGKEKFSASMQDRIFEQYLVGSKRHEIGDYIGGQSNDLHGALLGMSKEWASVADPDTGVSHYGGVGHNKASISVADATAALNDARSSQAGANGQVHVVVDFKNAPRGIVATAAASGAATVSAPRVETAMAGIG